MKKSINTILALFYVIIFINVLLFHLSGCKKNKSIAHSIDSKYYQYLENRKYQSLADSLYKIGLFQESLSTIDKIECENILCRFKNYSKAKSLLSLGKLEEAKEYLFLAFEQGHIIEFTDTILFSPIIENLKENIDTLHSVYFSKISEDVRKEIIEIINHDQQARIRNLPNKEIEKVDSINLSKLDIIVKEHGWPSDKLIGHRNPFENTDASLIILHSDLETNIKYLHIIIQSCIKGSNSWFDAESIISNIIFRHTRADNFFLVPYLEANNNISEKFSSMFMIDAIAKSLQYNRSYKLIVKSTTKPSLPSLLKDFKDLLIKKGVNEDQIELDNKQFPSINNEIIAVKVVSL